MNVSFCFPLRRRKAKTSICFVFAAILDNRMPTAWFFLDAVLSTASRK